MKILLDTHIILWALTNDERLPQKAGMIISKTENEIWYSAASVWEVTFKYMNHPDHMPISGKQLSQYCHRAGYRILPVQEHHVHALERLRRMENAPVHKDPFDRILISQAKAENMMFITHDSLLPWYREECIIAV